MESLPVEIKMVKIGRPKKLDKILFSKEYFKEYYLKNKEKIMGNYHCEKCNLMCSKANRLRHDRTHHS